MSNMLTKAWVRIPVQVLLFVVSVCLVAEVYLRFEQSRSLSDQEAGARSYYREVLARMHVIWLDVFDDSDPFLPPYVVFANRDLDDQERMETILRDSKLNFTGERSSYDFLQDPSRASSTQYTVTVNSLGFRGEERSAEKPDDVFRIIALGSYHTFGLGVNDDETYPAQLERMLNQGTAKNVEVWNGGKLAGTAIIALAQMQNEILAYDPDLVILDYGFIDTLVLDDNVFPPAMRFPDSLPSKMFRMVAGPVMIALNDSVLWNNIFFNQFIDKPRQDKLERFEETMRAVVEVARSNDIPVIVLSQLQVYPPNVFDDMADGQNVQVVKVRDVFSDSPPSYPPAEEWKTGYWSRTWLAELDPSIVDASDPLFEYYPYRLDFFQLNSRGLEVVASALAETIKESYLSRSPR